MAQSALIAAFLAGLVGGMHCFAMCGGYIAAVTSPPAAAPLLPMRTLLIRQLAAHAGRIGMYALGGAVLASAAGLASAALLTPLQKALYVVANLTLLVLAISIVRRRSPFAALERGGLALFTRIAPLGRLAASSKCPPMLARFLLGMLWGLTPCALVYALLPVAMLAGSAVDGAMVMLAFGLGTLPNLLAANAVVAPLRRALAYPRARAVVATIIAGFSVAGLARALFAADALAHGPFCLVP